MKETQKNSVHSLWATTRQIAHLSKKRSNNATPSSLPPFKYTPDIIFFQSIIFRFSLHETKIWFFWTSLLLLFQPSFAHISHCQGKEKKNRNIGERERERERAAKVIISPPLSVNAHISTEGGGKEEEEEDKTAAARESFVRLITSHHFEICTSLPAPPRTIRHFWPIFFRN